MKDGPRGSFPGTVTLEIISSSEIHPGALVVPLC
jgi:hypothetical protein